MFTTRICLIPKMMNMSLLRWTLWIHYTFTTTVLTVLPCFRRPSTWHMWRADTFPEQHRRTHLPNKLFHGRSHLKSVNTWVKLSCNGSMPFDTSGSFWSSAGSGHSMSSSSFKRSCMKSCAWKASVPKLSSDRVCMSFGSDEADGWNREAFLGPW